MSMIATILSRMMKDPAFADAVFSDTEETLAEYNLPADEMTKFKGMSRAGFDAFASASPEERKSFGSTGGGIVNNNNVLWGDYFYVDPTSR